MPPIVTTSSTSPSLVWSSLESKCHDCANNYERPDRVEAVASKLESDGELASICRRIFDPSVIGEGGGGGATPRARAAAEAVHSRAYLSRLEVICEEAKRAKKALKVADEDDETEFTYLTSTSLANALAAVETALYLWEQVDPRSSSSSSSSPSSLKEQSRAAMALVRPPGHHAGRGLEGAEADSPPGAPSGFCLVNTVAAVARSIASSTSTSSKRRVLVVDWDVHVGDGTQDIFWGHRRGGGDCEDGGADGGGEEEEEHVCVVDLHEAGAWPGGGGIEVRGQAGSGGKLKTGEEGTALLSRVINVPLPSGSGDAAARAAFERIVVPVAARLRPEAIVVSAGFDAHELEPLAGLNWKDETYQFLGAGATALARRHGCGLLFVLEGGYSRAALGSAAAALAKGAATLEAPESVEGGGASLVLGREEEAAIGAVVEEHGL